MGETEDLILAIYGAYRRARHPLARRVRLPARHPQEAGPVALLHGKNRIREAGEMRDTPIYWFAEVRDGWLHTFRPYVEISKATAAFEAGQS